MRFCNTSHRNSWTIVSLIVLNWAGLGCESAPPEPASKTSSPAPSAQAPAQLGSPKSAKSGSSGGDPVAGQFGLKEATEGLGAGKKLVASIKTDLGEMSCELFEDKAPITVANFVGLARGLRPFLHEGKWQKKPAYDGTLFHRVIKGFMIQGGDPAGNGSGEPGYVIPDEKWEGAKHDRRGLLCMANRGPDTNGMQFFITDAAAPHLDRSYTIFGQCGPDETIEKIASVQTYGSSGNASQRPDRPLTPPVIEKITIERK